MTGWDERQDLKQSQKDGWLNEHLRGWIGIDDGVKTLNILVSTSENMIYIDMIQLMLRRLAINST